MDQLINSLPALLRAAGDVEEVATAAAQAAWNHVAGYALRRHALATALHESRLTVAVSDVVWQRQLQSMSGQLVYRLNALLGAGTVTFIEFRVDPELLEAKLGKPKSIDMPADHLPLPVALVSAASSIHNPELRRAFLGAAGSSLRRREVEDAN